jgi:porphobilinogen synthase
MYIFPQNRSRRLRKNNSIRSLVQENHLSVDDLIHPIFLLEGNKTVQPIESMPGVNRYTLDEALKEIQQINELGIKAIALFPVVENTKKNPSATEALNPDNLMHRALREIKQRFPEILLISDVALDPYTDHGHDGLCDEKGNILNDETVEVLCKMALLQAQAGADIVAPSDMMDGRITKIRGVLEKNNLKNTLIMSYSAKFASSLYGPFREALSSSLSFGDKKTYQLNPANTKEALKKIISDTHEGADLLIVKPGTLYLDIISEAAKNTLLPIVAYCVSGEYSMIKAASLNGWIDERTVVLETMLSFKRAGASAIITYHAKEIANWLR